MIGRRGTRIAGGLILMGWLLFPLSIFHLTMVTVDGSRNPQTILNPHSSPDPNLDIPNRNSVSRTTHPVKQSPKQSSERHDSRQNTDSRKWFSPSIYSILRLRPRRANISSRPSYPRPAPSSWMSNAQAVSPSRPSSRTRRRSSSAVAAPPCSVSPPVARPG